jgi:intein-encoded DNA endonuclease-like protein
VIADAVRLVQWGRKWYELAEVIARMADRPSLTDVRRILKDNKADIDKKAGRA